MRFGQRPAGEPLGDGIHELDAARRVDGDDRVGDRRERDLRALLLLEQQRFRLPALVDVRQRADEALLARRKRILQVPALANSLRNVTPARATTLTLAISLHDEHHQACRRIRRIEHEVRERDARPARRRCR